MIKVTDIVWGDEPTNIGCTNGNYQPVTLILSDGSKIETESCRCGHGCSGTARLIGYGESRDCFVTDFTFKDRKDLEEFLFEDED